MDYILSGEPSEVAKVVREQRVRVERGVITLTPVQPDLGADDKTLPEETPKATPKRTPKKA